MYEGKIKEIKKHILGILFISCIAILVYKIANFSMIKNMHISPIIVGIIVGAMLSKVFVKYNDTLNAGVNFSAKRLLRLGIILFGFNISVDGVEKVGINGILVACCIVIIVFILSYVIGVKILKLDKQMTILIGIGNAVCGAAAIIAMESILKNKSYKSIIAISSIVIFGLCGMFLLPIIINTSLLPFNDIQKGVFIGSSLHEVANVVGAAGAILSNENTIIQYAIIVKMVRVIMLIPMLLLISVITSSSDSKAIKIPYFVIAFMFAILINSSFNININVSYILSSLSHILLVFAMIALGLQIDLSKIKAIGKDAFILSIILFISLIVISGCLVYILF